VVVETEPTGDEEQAETPTYEASEVVVKGFCDPDANWVKKGKVSTYGYKAHTMTDSNGIVVCMEVTSASVHDTVMFPDLIDKAQLSEGDTVYADKGYHSEHNKEILERRNLIDRIMHKRKRNEPGTRRPSTATKASPGAAMWWRGPLVLSNVDMAGAGLGTSDCSKPLSISR
jgi:IS5 family transposase